MGILEWFNVGLLLFLGKIVVCVFFVNPSNSYRIPGRSVTTNKKPWLRIGRWDVLTSTFMELYTSDVGWVTLCCLGSYC